MKKLFILLVIIINLSVNIWCQESSLEQANGFTGSHTRPSVALVLSGAGPRGFAHIPIIELMEELGIPIDFVLGTSSGAIVGGLYSAGYSGKELAQTVLDIDWPELLQDSTTHILSSAIGTHSSTTNLLNVKLDGDMSINLGGGLLTGQYVYSKVKSLTAKIPSYTDFDELPIPYRATAVDLVSGELVLIDNGDLAEAMRASMTLPGVFEPFPIDGRYYLDGFIKNTLPISAARDLGYDIVIAVEISEKLPEEASAVNSNPVDVINQVLAIQQASVTSQEYEYADLVLFPNLEEFGSADYAYSKEIYAKGKTEAERFRDELLELKERFFPVLENEASENSNEIPEEINQVAILKDGSTVQYRDRVLYADLPSLVIEEINLKNVYLYDENMILDEFEKIKGIPLDEKTIENFLRRIYESSNYLMLTSRVNTQSTTPVLEVEFYQKEFESILIGAMQTFEGTFSKNASWDISTTATVQFYDFLGLGGVLSIQGSLLSKSGLEVMHMQPLSDKMFLRSTLNGFQLIDIETSGFAQTEISASYFRQGNAAFAFGVFFSEKHKLLNEIGLHWIDSSRTITELGDGVFNVDDLDIAYTADAYSRYTFNGLDSLMFPTKGFYNDFTILGGIPLEETKTPVFFEVLSTDMIVAIPFNKNFSVIMSGFIGTNISEVLNQKPELVTKYGFTTYDRVFFPHVMQRFSYGIHKLALKADFQFKPDKALTVLGGQFFFGAGGAVGNVWDNYTSLTAFDDLEWQSSAYTGFRITERIGLSFRVGAGNYNGEIEPFASVDFMIRAY